jgi:subtilase-type serine protease
VKKFKYRPLSLALACMLAPYQYLHASDVPLDIIQESYGGNQFGYRLGINVGVNGATPEEYLFDTGSDSFNIDVGTNTGGHGAAWFPNQPGVAQSAPYAYLYGNGTYGYWQSDTTVSSVQFYNSASGAKVGSIATPQGLPVAIAQDWMGTQASLAPDTPGQAITTIGGNTLYQDLTWQQSLNQGNAPEEGRFYGTFGTGDFGNGIAGSLTKSGYIVEANGAAGDPGKCGSACLIVGLTPALRAQFLSVVPWIGGGQGTFPLSGAPAANQFDTQFLYVLTDGKHSSSATLPTLFDTGTPNIMIIDNDLGVLTHETALGHINSNNDEIPGITLTATGVSAGSQPSSIVTGNDASGDYSNVVTVGPYGGFPDSAIYGISFFFHNAVMYDLQNKATGYTPYYVSDSPITTSFTVTSAMGPLGLAGVISGTGTFQVASGAVANLSGTNTYTGSTNVAKGGWLGLAGPGSLAQSSGIHIDGTFDISRTSQSTAARSLSGAGNVLLGGTTLVLTNAVGTFSGQLADGGLGGGVGGRLIVAGGKEMLTGHSTYTGWTGVSAPGELDLSSSGSLAGSAINLGVLSNSGLISGSVINRGQLVDNGSIMGSVSNDGMLTGQGRIGGDLVVSGTVAPGNAAASYRTLTVSGNYTQSAGSAYLAQLSPLQAGTSSLIAVNGNATLAPGAKFGLVVASPGQLYSLGARYTVLTANQGLSGTYTLGQAALSAVLGIDPIYDAKHFSLEVVQRRALMAVGGTRNETAALAALQHLPSSNTLFTAVTSLQSDGQIRNAADQLDGEIHASVQNTFLEDSRYVRDAVFGRLRQATQDEPTAAAAATSAPTVQTQSNGLAWWGQFVGSWGHGDGDGNAAAMSQTLSGFLIGADMPVGENTSVGVASGYTQTALNISKGTSSAASDDAYLSLYSGTQLGAFGLSMGAAYTQHSLDTSRTIALADFTDHTQSSSKAYTAQVFGEAGYQFQLKTTTLEPFAQAAYVRLTDDAFQEHGGAAALAGSGDDRAVTYMTLGAHAATNFQFNGDLFTAHGTLGWRHSFGDVNPDTAMTFTGGSSFNVEGLPIARNALVVDTGLDLHIARNAVLSLSYSGQIARHAVDSGVRGGFIWRF